MYFVRLGCGATTHYIELSALGVQPAFRVTARSSSLTRFLRFMSAHVLVITDTEREGALQLVKHLSVYMDTRKSVVE
jgi:hypothetical protein